jgi:hypothetical protein
MRTPNTMTKGEGFTTFTPATEWYRGYKIQQCDYEILVYDMSGTRPQIVWGESAGEDGWEKCKRWLDDGLYYSIPSPTWKIEYDHWIEDSHQNCEV